MRQPILYLLALVLSAAAAGAPAPSFADDKPGSKTVAPKRALIKTTMGDIEVELWPWVAPQTVRVFLGLANGKGTFTDVRNPAKKVTIDKPFYDGVKFHRVIKGFMLQGGCPQGTGTGDPGFWFADEINATALGLDKIKAFQGGRPHGWLGLRSQREFQQKIGLPLLKKMGINPSDQSAIQARQADLNARLAAMSLKEAYELMGYRYDDKLPSKKPLKGYLALANSGPNSNGSQFFINLVDTPHLTGKHTVFGRVTKGMDVVEKIGVVPVDPKSAKPIKDVRILSIRSLP